jgi:integrase
LNFLASSVCDYRANGRKSLLKHADETEYICGVSALDEFFAGSRVAEITAPRIREFFLQRQLRAVPNATINRSLARLRRMFRLAFQHGSLRVVPHFPMLKENNVRKGFVVHDQYTLLRDALPDYLKPVLAMGYFTGMREGEILPLRLDQLSIRDSQVLLDPGTTSPESFRSRLSCAQSSKCNWTGTSSDARTARFCSSTEEERSEYSARHGRTHAFVWG